MDLASYRSKNIISSSISKIGQAPDDFKETVQSLVHSGCGAVFAQPSARFLTEEHSLVAVKVHLAVIKVHPAVDFGK